MGAAVVRNDISNSIVGSELFHVVASTLDSTSGGDRICHDLVNSDLSKISQALTFFFS